MRRVLPYSPTDQTALIDAVSRQRSGCYCCPPVSLIVANARWRRQMLVSDLVPQAIAAADLLDHGSIPYRGSLTSYASFTPPGTTWLLALGAVVTRDVSLVEMPGAALMFILTCLGLYALARRLFDAPIALLALALFAFSQIGQFYASSLWQRAHPAFYVWMCYCALLWMQKRDGRYLSAALLLYGLGMYVFMELAPALLILPAIGIYRRPPLHWRSLMVAGVAVLIVWLPYLQFEAGRSFADLRSQVLRVNLLPANAHAAYCDPAVTFPPFAPNPGDSTGIYAVALMAAAAAIVERKRLSSWFFLMPFAVLLVIAEPGRHERYYWLWAMEALVVASVFYGRSRRVQWVFGGLLVIAVCGFPVLTGSTFLGHLRAMTREGIAGSPSALMVQTETLGSQLQSRGITHAAIGYQIPAVSFVADDHTVDPVYKVGMEYDLMLQWEYGVTNTLTCAEGITPNAAYLIRDR